MAIPVSLIVNPVFHINVYGIPPNEIPSYMKEVKQAFLQPDSHAGIDYVASGVVWEDLFLPVRKQPTGIEFHEFRPS